MGPLDILEDKKIKELAKQRQINPKDEDKIGYQTWENISNLPGIKQIGQYNRWTAKNKQAYEDRARSGELGKFSQGLQIASDYAGLPQAATGLVFGTALEGASDILNVDKRSIITALTIAGLAKPAYRALNKSPAAHQTVHQAGQNLGRNVDRLRSQAKFVKDQFQYATGQKLRPMYKKPDPFTNITQVLDGQGRIVRRAKKIYDYHAGGISFAEAMKVAKELPDRSSSKYWYQDSELALKKGGITDPNRNDTNKMMFSTGVDPVDPEFDQLVTNIDKEKPVNYKLTPPPTFISKSGKDVPDSQLFEEWTTQELEQLGPAFKTYMGKRPYKDAATAEGLKRMVAEVNATFEDLLGPDFDRELVSGYMKAVDEHEVALKSLQELLNKGGKLWHRQHATALRKLHHSGRMLGNKGLFPAWNFPDTLDQTPLGRPKVAITREGNAPDPTARGADFQRVLSRVLGKPLSLHESILYWYDQDMFYYWKELTPLQRQQLVDSSRTRSGGRIKSELTVAENINQALEAMKFGKETLSGQIGRNLTPQERLEALVSNAQAELLRTRKYNPVNTTITGDTITGPDGTPIKTKGGKDLKETTIIQTKSNLKGPRQGNVFYDIDTGEPTDYSPDLTGKGAYFDVDSGESYHKYNPE